MNINSLSDVMKLNDKEFVENIYRLFLGREADPDGVIAVNAALESGVSRLSIISSITKSKEFLIKESGADLIPLPNAEFVDKIYQRYLGRTADEAGRRVHLRALEKGKRKSSLISSIKKSPEYQRRHQLVENLISEAEVKLKDDRFSLRWWRGFRRISRIELQLNRIERKLAGLSVAENGRNNRYYEKSVMLQASALKQNAKYIIDDACRVILEDDLKLIIEGISSINFQESEFYIDEFSKKINAKQIFFQPRVGIE